MVPCLLFHINQPGIECRIFWEYVIMFCLYFTIQPQFCTTKKKRKKEFENYAHWLIDLVLWKEYLKEKKTCTSDVYQLQHLEREKKMKENKNISQLISFLGVTLEISLRIWVSYLNRGWINMSKALLQASVCQLGEADSDFVEWSFDICQTTRRQDWQVHLQRWRFNQQWLAFMWDAKALRGAEDWQEFYHISAVFGTISSGKAALERDSHGIQPEGCRTGCC